MKVLMTADTLGGVWTYCMELCTALRSFSVDVVLATMGRRLSEEQYSQAASLNNVEVRESEYRLCWMQDPWADVTSAGEWLLELERQVRPDLVHLNDLGHGGLPWQSPVLLVGHSCVLSWWQAVKKQPAPGENWQRYQQLVARGVQQATLVAAPTQAMLSELLKFYGPARAALVLPNGRDYPRLNSPSSSKVPQPYIFAAGRVWDEAKNIGALAQVALLLPWPVYVAGEQNDPNGGSVRLPGVRHLGAISSREMEAWLRQASIYVAPAHYEPFGLAILEAARAGCVLVLGDIRSLREIWGDTAIYIDPDDPGALKTELLALINDPPRRRQLAQRSWQRARHFSATAMAANYTRCYSLLSRNRTARPGNPPTSSLGALL